MRVDELKREITELEGNQFEVNYKFQFFNSENDPIENKQVQVFAGDKLVFDTDTNAEGVADVEVIANIMEETLKQITFVVDGERRDKVLLFEFGAKQREERTRALEAEQKALEEKRKAEQMAIEKAERARRWELKQAERARQKVLEDEEKAKQMALEKAERTRQKALEEKERARKNRISVCEKFFADLGVGIVTEHGKKFFMNENGDLLSDGYDEIVLFDGKMLAKVRRGSKYALMDITGKIILEWCDEIMAPNFEGAWAVKKNEKYYLCAEFDNGKIKTKWWNDKRYVSVMKGLMKTFVDDKAFLINSEFESVEIDTFDQYLDKLRQADSLTLEECEKLRSLTGSYETAVKGAKALHPEGEVPTLDHIELELTKLGAAELRDICTHMRVPVLVIEPAISFKENMEALNDPPDKIEIIKLSALVYSEREKDNPYSLARTEKVAVYIAEGKTRLGRKSGKYKKDFETRGERPITNIGIGAYQSMLMGSVVEAKEYVNAAHVIDIGHTTITAATSFLNILFFSDPHKSSYGFRTYISLDPGCAKKNEVFVSLSANIFQHHKSNSSWYCHADFSTGSRIFGRRSRASMQLFEFDPEEVDPTLYLSP